MADEKVELRVSEIGEYIHHNSCARRFKLEINGRELGRSIPFFDRLFNPLDPVLQETGRKREDEWATQLNDEGFLLLQPPKPGETPDGKQSSQITWEQFGVELKRLPEGSNAFAREIEIEGNLGAYQVKGRIDFVLLLWRNGKPYLRIVEAKSSRKDQTYHRIQVCIYKLLITRALEEQPLDISGHKLTAEDLECIVTRVDEVSGKIQRILDIPALELILEEADLQTLLSLNGALASIIDSDLDKLPYQIDGKCDGCVFNVHCLSESGRQRRLELTGLSPSLIRILNSNGINNIDDLATLDPTSEEASQIRSDQNFTVDLDTLILKAQARRSTLPGGRANPDEYQAMAFPHRAKSALPPYEINNEPLVRVYLSVHFDYVENRIGALSAHVTTSQRTLYTPFAEIDGRFQPEASIVEIDLPKDRTGIRLDGLTRHSVSGRNVVRIKSSPWTSDERIDSPLEAELIKGFLDELVGAIAEISARAASPLHFYVWSRGEIRQLVEACSRVDTRLLSHLNELLGCRESLEQLIFSCLQDEVDNRYALGWTGRGLSVMSSLTWFGQRFHWRRTINGQPRDLDNIFTQDLFDFKTDLALDGTNQWAHEGGAFHKFEVRSRFYDSLTLPYWHARWGTLPDSLDARVQGMINRYRVAAGANLLESYLTERCHALRWVEGFITKNHDITKPLLEIDEISQFDLGIDRVDRAATDFLRLDHHTSVSDWISKCLMPPASRVAEGITIPVRDLRQITGNRIECDLNLEPYGIGNSEFEAKCALHEGFVRVIPHEGNPFESQSLGNLTNSAMNCVIEGIDWQNGTITLTPMHNPASFFRLSGRGAPIAAFEFATIDSSPSDFVADRVCSQITRQSNHHAYQWFDHRNPMLPEKSSLPLERLGTLRQFLDEFRFEEDLRMSSDQSSAVIEGLGSRVQRIQGPPGTGKTQTCAVSLLTRIMNSCSDGDIVFVAANTHTAVNNLLLRIDRILDDFSHQARESGLDLPLVNIAKIKPTNEHEDVGGRVQNWLPHRVTPVNNARDGAVLIVGSTTSTLLRFANEMSQKAAWRDTGGLRTKILAVDEASMILFPHFLALATLTTTDAEILLAGDHRQLAPIVAHDWEREDRPPVQLFQPYVSAYDAINLISQHPDVHQNQVCLSQLSYTYRLPPMIRNLISRVYRLDAIELTGKHDAHEFDFGVSDSNWTSIWSQNCGLYLLVHSERESRRSNDLEVQIVKRVLEAADDLVEDSIAIVTPHRAQRTKLRSNLTDWDKEIFVIDTVERMQGGEKPIVIVSGTVSDPTAIASSAEFILNLNRANVAFSRTMDRLFVVCSDSLLSHIPAQVDHYENAMLWKAIRRLCSKELFEAAVSDHSVKVFVPSIASHGAVTG